VTVGREWTRQEFSFVPSQPFLFIEPEQANGCCGAGF